MDLRKKALIFDIFFFTILGILSEAINFYAINKFYTDFYFSISLIVVFIAIFRWGSTGAIIAPVMGLVFSILLDNTTSATFIIEIFGNLGILFSILYLKVIDREKILDNPYWALLYISSGFFGIIILKSIISLFYGINLVSGVLLITSNLMLSFIVITIFFIMLRKQKSILVDMNQYYDELLKEE